MFWRETKKTEIVITTHFWGQEFLRLDQYHSWKFRRIQRISEYKVSFFNTNFL